MIYLERTITIANSNASIDEQIVLYKGDRNVEVQFILKNSQFKYKNMMYPTYGQLIINRPKADSIFSGVSETVNGKILFVITGDMIDELNECGDYDFQIRLFNEDKTSRVTLMPIEAGITIRKPICEGDEENEGIKITDFYYEELFNYITNNNTNYSRLFQGYNSTTLNLSKLNTGNVINMEGMFDSCVSLTSLDLSNFNTSRVTDMGYMFQYCSSLTQLDLSSFNTSNVIYTDKMFWSCSNLISLNLSKFDMSSIITVTNMFGNCTSLQELRLDNCSNDTVDKIINSSGFPVNNTGTIFCSRAAEGVLTAPGNWVFSYID